MSARHLYSRFFFPALMFLSLTSCAALSAALPPQVVVSLKGAGVEVPLENAVIYGDVTITARDEGAREAGFYLNDDAATGAPLFSTATSPMTFTLETRALTDGPHTLTLKLLAPDGTASLEQIPFTVGNKAYAMLQGVNALRARGYDCGTEGTFGTAPALRLESRLMRAAQRQADDMNANDFLEHTGSDGSTVATRVNDTGYGWSRVGENLASGQETIEEVVSAWAESDGHCANLMNPSFTELGVGRAGTYWAQVFAHPR